MKDVIEFDSVITEKALNNFKTYHNLHNTGGVFGYIFAVFALVMSGVGIASKMDIKYVLMMIAFGVFFLVYPTLSGRANTKRQMKKIDVFKAPMHYVVTEEKIVLSQGEMSEELGWDQIYKIKFTGKNLLMYINAIRANILTVDTMGDEALDFVDMCEKKLKGFQVKVDKKKLANAIKKQGK